MKFRIIEVYEFDSNDFRDWQDDLDGGPISIERLKSDVQSDPYSFVEGCEPKETKIEFDE